MIAEPLAVQLAALKEHFCENDWRVRASARETEFRGWLVEVPDVRDAAALGIAGQFAVFAIFRDTISVHGYTDFSSMQPLEVTPWQITHSRSRRPCEICPNRP